MNELRNIATDLWVVDQPFKMMGCEVGVRMTVVRSGNGLLLHSPVKPEADWIEAVRALGEVRWVVAPSLMHNLFAPAVNEAFPEAELFGPVGFERVQPNVTARRLDDAGFEGLDAIAIAGAPKIEETVFVHTSSRTLIVTDLLFNIPASASWLTRTFFKLNGGAGRVVQTKVFKNYVKDKEAHMESIHAVIERDFDRIILSHGTIVESGGKEILKNVYGLS